MPSEARPPIFIVGSPRSGTTLTRLIIDSHPDIACGPETHFLIQLEEITTTHWVRMQRYGYDKEYWYRRNAELFDSFQREYAAKRGKTRWADKTPPYAKHLPYVLNLFPNAQLLHVIRDPRAVVASWAQRWGWKSALVAPKIWLDSVSAAQTIGATLPASQYKEIRFEDLVSSPEAVMRPVFEWLGEPWDDGVLQYDKQRHDSGGRVQEISAQAREQTGTAINVNRAGSKPELDPVLRAETALVTGRLARKLGY